MGDDLTVGVGVQGGVKQLIETIGLDSPNGFLPA